jgi:tetratricopeptide (TPR) repeat protein
MKSTERHRLKENEVASTFARLSEVYDAHRHQIAVAGTAVVVLIAAVVAFVMWRAQTSSRSEAMLADAMATERAEVAPAPVPGATAPAAPAPAGSYPTEKVRNEAALAKFMAVADASPSSDAGIAARYHAAAMLTALGRHTEAGQRYQEVIDRAGASVYGQMAKLGKADAEVAAGKFDQAIAAYKELSANKDTELPVDGILMQLARAFDAAGKPADARQAFKRIVDEFPQSPYSAEAKRALDQSKG